MVDKTLTMSEDEVLHYLESESIPKTKAFAEQQQKLAKKYNLELMAYEAGQHLVGAGWTQKLGLLTDNKKLAEKFINVNRNVKMKELYLAFYKNWQEIGGGLLVWFQATGKASRWGSWGLLENMGDISKKSPKYQAFQLIMSKTACTSNK